MHVLAVHRFPDATGVTFALTALARYRCLQLYFLLFLIPCFIALIIIFNDYFTSFYVRHFELNLPCLPNFYSVHKLPDVTKHDIVMHFYHV